MFFRHLLIILAALNFAILEIRPSHQTFDVLRNSEFFVDQTGLIRDCLDRRGMLKPRKVLLKSRRGFGKTTTLDMIRHFVEIDFYPNGTIKTNQKTHKNYKLFTDIIPSTGKYLTVSTQNGFFRQNMGAYSVIWLDLNPKNDYIHDGDSYTRLLQKNTIRAAFEDHLYLFSSSAISAQDKDDMKNFLQLNFPNCSAHEDHFRAYSPRAGLKLLKRLLHAHFQRSIIALVDNIDFAFRGILRDPYQHSDRAVEKLTILAGFLEAIPAFDTGAQAPAPLYTIMAATVEPFNVLEWSLRRYCDGLYVSGNEAVFTSASLAPIDKIQAWYGGYGSGDPGRRSYGLINPFSLLSFLNSESKAFDLYWPKLEPLDLFRTALVPECFGRVLMECLFSCGFVKPVKVNFQMSLNYTLRLMALERLTFPVVPSQCLDEDLRIFLAYLHDVGYLNHNGRTGRQITGHEHWNRFQTFSVPNLEVRNYLSRVLFEASYISTPLNGDEKFRLEFFEAVFGVNGSEVSFRKFAEVLVMIFLAESEKGTVATVAHSVRAQLLYPPPGFNVSYVKTGRSDEDLNEERNLRDFDLVFVVDGKKFSTGFVIEFELDKNSSISNRTLNAPADVFTARMFRDRDESKMLKVVANLCCDKIACRLRYLCDGTSLGKVEDLVIELTSVAKKLSDKYNPPVVPRFYNG